jgi:hypothetical protein
VRVNNNERKEGFKMVSSKFMGERQTKEKKGFRLNWNRKKKGFRGNGFSLWKMGL